MSGSRQMKFIRTSNQFPRISAEFKDWGWSVVQETGKAKVGSFYRQAPPPQTVIAANPVGTQLSEPRGQMQCS